jgi:hypothetical protein
MDMRYRTAMASDDQFFAGFHFVPVTITRSHMAGKLVIFGHLP